MNRFNISPNAFTYNKCKGFNDLFLLANVLILLKANNNGFTKTDFPIVYFVYF